MKLTLSLARGLSYYTGLIVEGQFENANVGSVCGGGRYDNLCQSIGNFSVPCVGFSIGVSRILSAILSRPESENFFLNDFFGLDVFIGSAYGLLLKERLSLLGKVQKYFKSETFTGIKVNFKSQLDYAHKNKFKVCIFTGEKEEKENTLVLFDLKTNEKREISKDKMMEELHSLLNKSLN